MTPKCHDWQVRSGSPFHRHFFFNYPLMCLFGSAKKYRICFTSISATAEKASYSRLERDSPSARAISSAIALNQSWLKWESRRTANYSTRFDGFARKFSERIVPWQLEKFWLGHASRDISDRYAEGLSDDLQWRKQVAQQTGLGFCIPVGQLGRLSIEEKSLAVAA